MFARGTKSTRTLFARGTKGMNVKTENSHLFQLLISLARRACFSSPAASDLFALFVTSFTIFINFLTSLLTVISHWFDLYLRHTSYHNAIDMVPTNRKPEHINCHGTTLDKCKKQINKQWQTNRKWHARNTMSLQKSKIPQHNLHLAQLNPIILTGHLQESAKSKKRKGVDPGVDDFVGT
jgi:hypothetical protein